jgi:hypothetical protein
MLQQMALIGSRTAAAAALLLTLAVAGCGSDNDGTGKPVAKTTPAATAAPTVTVAPDATVEPEATPDVFVVHDNAETLLFDWTETIVPILLTARDRGKAYQAGDVAKNDRLTRRLIRQLRPVTKWGRDARKAFVDAEPDKATRAVTAAGDAWTKWALALRTTEAIDYDEGARIADLGVTAIRHTRRAYKALGEDIPPVWQTSSGG